MTATNDMSCGHFDTLPPGALKLGHPKPRSRASFWDARYGPSHLDSSRRPRAGAIAPLGIA